MNVLCDFKRFWYFFLGNCIPSKPVIVNAMMGQDVSLVCQPNVERVLYYSDSCAYPKFYTSWMIQEHAKNDTSLWFDILFFGNLEV